jgi:cytochrome c
MMPAIAMEDFFMKRLMTALGVTAALTFTVPANFAPAAFADEAATPQEIIAKVKEAAAYLATEGEAGLALFDAADTRFVWKDTYVFVWDCLADVVVAHPVPAVRGIAISTVTDVTGKTFGPALCNASARPDGGWAEYMWQKPVKQDGADNLAYEGDAARKVSYMLSVDGQPYQVGAGEYNDTATVEELDALLVK